MKHLKDGLLSLLILALAFGFSLLLQTVQPSESLVSLVLVLPAFPHSPCLPVWYIRWVWRKTIRTSC